MRRHAAEFRSPRKLRRVPLHVPRLGAAAVADPSGILARALPGGGRDASSSHPLWTEPGPGAQMINSTPASDAPVALTAGGAETTVTTHTIPEGHSGVVTGVGWQFAAEDSDAQGTCVWRLYVNQQLILRKREVWEGRWQRGSRLIRDADLAEVYAVAGPRDRVRLTAELTEGAATGGVRVYGRVKGHQFPASAVAAAAASRRCCKG